MYKHTHTHTEKSISF